MISTATERNRAKQGLQCPECWSTNTVIANDDHHFVCRSCGEQWDKHYFGEDEREDEL